ncbi:MAG: 3-keto-5-aminohexanoate cleavage protein [Chloroflexi bacterium]|nr:3-keto-5-aminohexanoate cleavage protein [Chloroflexota bacterium]
MRKLMIEAAINELASKEQNPNVPYGPEEVARDAIACAKAGATIVHFHARDADTGEQLWQSVETYAQAIKLIRRECDAILYPTYRSGVAKEQRIAHIVSLADDPDVRLELATLDLGATNTGAPSATTGEGPAGAYVNTHRDVMYFMRTLREHGVFYSLGVRDVGHMRHIQAYAEAGLVQSPWAVKIFMSEQDAHGPLPDARGLMMYLDMVPPGVECHWFVTTYKSASAHARVNMLAAAMGGHIRTGLGDNPVLDGRVLTNAQQVEMAVDLAHKAGREVATPAEGRQMMGMTA